MKKGFTRTYLEVVLMVSLVSLLIFALDVAFPFLNDFMRGFTLSFGLLSFMLSLFLRFNKKVLKKIEVNEKDERKIMINEKALSIAYYVHLLLTVVVIVIFGFIDTLQLVSVVLAALILVETICLYIARYIYSLKY